MNDLNKVTRVSNLRRSVDLLYQNDIIASNHCVDNTLAVLHEKYGWRDRRRWRIRILLYQLGQPWVKWSRDSNDEMEYTLFTNLTKEIIIIKHNLGQKDFPTSHIFFIWTEVQCGQILQTIWRCSTELGNALPCSWPELQGKDVEEARKVIQEECPDVHIQVLGAVRVFVVF